MFRFNLGYTRFELSFCLWIRRYAQNAPRFCGHRKRSAFPKIRQQFVFDDVAHQEKYMQTSNAQKAIIEEKFTKNVPQWEGFRQVRKFLGIQKSVGELLIPRFSTFFATAWWQWLLLPVAYMMAPIHGVIINWFAHIYGYTNFKVSDTSKNLLKFDWLMMGESISQ